MTYFKNSCCTNSLIFSVMICRDIEVLSMSEELLVIEKNQKSNKRKNSYP
jgi:hypothetical protein